MKSFFLSFALLGCAATAASAISVADYGAVPDDQGDDTAAIQMALDVSLTLRADVEIPVGNYIISAPLVWSMPFRQTLSGQGQARLEWRGTDPTAAILVFADAYACRLEGLWFYATTPAAVVLHIFNDPATAVRNPHSCTFDRLSIDCAGRVAKAVRISGVDAQNDFHHFSHCQFITYTLAGVSMEASQIYHIRFDQCNFKGYGMGDYGITTGFAGGSGVGGSFHVNGGLFAGHKEADFYLGVPSPGPITIDNIDSEASARLLVTRGSSASAWVRVSGIRWAASAAVPADRRIVQIGSGGTFLFESSNLYLYGAGTPKVFALGGWAGKDLNARRSIMFRGCSFASLTETIWDGFTPAELVGCFRTENTHDAFALTLP